ncbi:MAG: c-type cytochrome [Armatimonadetes bacterium]|nr:c-type cytochrome [Armatimonadota bacterium]
MISKAFAAASSAFFLLLALAGWQSVRPEWWRHQREYTRLVAEQGDGDPAFTTGIRQITNPELSVVDRCPTCHLGVENPLMARAPQPFRSHPHAERHPYERYGCTVCHGGQGRATTARAAHGREGSWPRPLLPLEFIDASCSKCHRGGSPVLGRRMEEGKRLFTERACIGCHKLGGRGGSLGPTLDAVGVRHTAEWLIRHFRDPQAMVPGSRMPPLRLSDRDVRVLTVFMLSQVPERIPDDYLTVRQATRDATPPAHTRAAPIGAVEAGRRVYQRYGCVVCHGEGGQGGVPNPNSQDGRVPPLIYVADELLDREIRDRILQGSIPEKKDPGGPDPLYIMPAWKGILTEQDAYQVVEYLKSLLPKDAKEFW